MTRFLPQTQYCNLIAFRLNQHASTSFDDSNTSSSPVHPMRHCIVKSYIGGVSRDVVKDKPVALQHKNEIITDLNNQCHVKEPNEPCTKVSRD